MSAEIYVWLVYAGYKRVLPEPLNWGRTKWNWRQVWRLIDNNLKPPSRQEPAETLKDSRLRAGELGRLSNASVSQPDSRISPPELGGTSSNTTNNIVPENANANDKNCFFEK